MYCKICGFMNKENSNFCCKCGETLADENVQGKNGLQKQTWIILIVSIIISLVIGVTSTMFLTSGEVKTVVELVLTGEEQAISEAHALMEDLSDKQKKDVINKINEELLRSCELYISDKEFSEDFYTRVVKIGQFLDVNGEIKKDTIAGLPTGEFCYNDLLDNASENLDVWVTAEEYIGFLNDISGAVEDEAIRKITQAKDVRMAFTEAVEMYDDGKYQQALTACTKITPAPEDEEYIAKIDELKSNILSQYGESCVKEIEDFVKQEKYAEAWELINSIIEYYPENSQMKERYEEVTIEYIDSLVRELNIESAENVADEAYAQNTESEIIKEYVEKLKLPQWKMIYDSILNLYDKNGTKWNLYKIQKLSNPYLLVESNNKTVLYLYYSEQLYELENVIAYDENENLYWTYETPEMDVVEEYEEYISYKFTEYGFDEDTSISKSIFDVETFGDVKDYRLNGKSISAEEYEAVVQGINSSKITATNEISDELINKIIYSE